ncbi:hypothetical protein Btru_076974 [Bulinus truncatus]|nr:hypothetical protein Btru_076974 [Bulinus truncatus]
MDKTQNLPQEDGYHYFNIQKEVVIIGAGVAGLAAARRISSDQSNFSVSVYEARRDRFGGRVWTDKLDNQNVKGIEVDLGASALNVISKTNPLIELAENFELKSSSLDSLQFILPWEQKHFSGDELSQITQRAVQILGQAINESKSIKHDISVKEAIDMVLNKNGDVSESPEAYFVKCLPSYLLGDYSIHHYNPEYLDFGYEKVLLDGMGELTDRLLSGSPDEPPLHLFLNKAARQIKIDKKKRKVLIRFRDGSQVSADRIVVAVPASVLGARDVLFEPPLPKKYQVAAKEISMSAGNKVIVQFEHAFWSNDHGVFVRAVNKNSEMGELQTWINIKHLVGVPALAGFLTGDAALRFEKMNDEEAKQLVLSVLTEMFGEEKIKTAGNITKFKRSSWAKDEFSKGASTYSKVGSDPAMWDTFAQPFCPYIFFAGEHTLFNGHGTLHGAYNSGIRAGDQILTGFCETQQREKEKRKLEEKRKKMEGKLKTADDSNQNEDGDRGENQDDDRGENQDREKNKQDEQSQDKISKVKGKKLKSDSLKNKKDSNKDEL